MAELVQLLFFLRVLEFFVQGSTDCSFQVPAQFADFAVLIEHHTALLFQLCFVFEDRLE